MCNKFIVHYNFLVQHPSNDTYCEGSNAVLSCVVFDTSNFADTTSWFTNDNPPVRVPDNIINNTRDGDVVTSVLTIESVSLNDNGNGYFCFPIFGIESSVGVISVAGEYEHLFVHTYIHTFMYHVCCNNIAVYICQK